MGSNIWEQTSDLVTTDEQQNYAYAAQLITLIVLPMTLQTVSDLGVFDIIAKAKDGADLSATQITNEITNTNPNIVSMIDRMLRLLASHSVVGCSVWSLMKMEKHKDFTV
uniref:O-methyltransferase dimerisation domain-containing protein n=1 Tax=Cucumis melo TaxID=3656 RepID=A0A9I9D795_CUCME